MFCSNMFCCLMLQGLVTAAQDAEVSSYVAAAARKSDRERSELQKDKSGVFTGKFMLNCVVIGCQM